MGLTFRDLEELPWGDILRFHEECERFWEVAAKASAPLT